MKTITTKAVFPHHCTENLVELGQPRRVLPLFFQHWGGQNQNGDYAESILFDGQGEEMARGLSDADGEFIAACREWVPDALRRIKRVREIHQPIKALNTRYPGGKLTQVCTGCGQDDGNWNQWPCPTIRALDGDK